MPVAAKVAAMAQVGIRSLFRGDAMTISCDR
jgi:hypothetical protein